MEDIRKSLSKLKKGFKRRLGGKKHAQDRAGADTAGEMVSSSGSFLHPRIAVSGHDGGESRISMDVSQAHSRGPSLHPDPVPADEGRLDDPQREVDVDEKGVTRKHLSVDPGVEGVAGSGPGREVEVSSPRSAALISPKQEPDSTGMLSPQLLCLTTYLRRRGRTCRS